MKNKLTLEWFYAAGIRAIRTVAQTALGMFAVGATISEIDWLYVGSVSIVAGIFSLLTSIATTLPELSMDGVLQIDISAPDKDTYLLELNNEFETLQDKNYIRLKVDTNASLPSQN